MRSMLRFAPVLFQFALVGCGGSKEPIELRAEMEPRDEKFFPMTAPNKAWKVNVAVKSEGVPIDIYFVKAGTEDEAARIVRKADHKQMIESRVDKPNPTFEATIPADTAYGIFVMNADRNRRARVTILLTEP